MLLPKKVGDVRASDFRPVSLMHSVAKILCKLLARRLAPELKSIISTGQSAFIKGRSIQDNFLFVQNAIQDSFRKKWPLVFMKLDIVKAFDSVHWAFFAGFAAVDRLRTAMERFNCHLFGVFLVSGAS